MSKVFRQVVSLWIAPDFTAVEQGRMAPPFVDHDTVDFDSLGKLIEDEFRCAESVRVRMANDTIDQVTIHMRMLSSNPESTQCYDFAQALFAVSGGRKPVMDVRDGWVNLHKLKDRRRAPPPVVLMFVVEGGFEAVTLWKQQASLRLGIRAADILVSMRGATPEEHEGRLTPGLASKLQELFGIAYKPFCQFHRTPAHSPLPEWAQ